MWFEPHMAGWIGGIGGSVIGVLGGTFGALAGIFVRKGKFKKFILTYAIVLIVIGAASLCTGLFALITGQPYHVWYPFTLIGALLSIQMPIFFRMMKKIYIQVELNKMNIDDLT